MRGRKSLTDRQESAIEWVQKCSAGALRIRAEAQAEVKRILDEAATVEKRMLRKAVNDAIEAGVPKSVIAERGLGMKSRTGLYRLMEE